MVEIWSLDLPTWRGGRVVDGSGLENQRGASLRGFESHPLRIKNPVHDWVFLCLTPVMAAPWSRPDLGQVLMQPTLVGPAHSALKQRCWSDHDQRHVISFTAMPAVNEHIDLNQNRREVELTVRGTSVVLPQSLGRPLESSQYPRVTLCPIFFAAQRYHNR